MSALSNPFRFPAFFIKGLCCILTLLMLTGSFMSIKHSHQQDIPYQEKNLHDLDSTHRHTEFFEVNQQSNKLDSESQNHHHHQLSTLVILRQKNISPKLVTIVFAILLFFSIYRKTSQLQILQSSSPSHRIPSLYHQKVLLRI